MTVKRRTCCLVELGKPFPGLWVVLRKQKLQGLQRLVDELAGVDRTIQLHDGLVGQKSMATNQHGASPVDLPECLRLEKGSVVEYGYRPVIVHHLQMLGQVIRPFDRDARNALQVDRLEGLL